MISTKGRYGLRVMFELASRNPEEWVSLKSIASEQALSKKYLELITKNLVHDGLVEGLRGKGGGYRLTRTPEEYSCKEIIESAEGSLAPVACLKDPEYTCERAEICQTLPLWKAFSKMTDSFFSNISLRDLMNGKFPEVMIEAHPDPKTEGEGSADQENEQEQKPADDSSCK